MKCRAPVVALVAASGLEPKKGVILMKSNRRCMTSMLAVGFAAVILGASSATAAVVNFDSIDTSTSPFYVDITSTNYLAQYGITLVNNTPGTTVDVLCANALYNNSCTSGTGALVAPSSPNVLIQNGNNFGESYTLNFSQPLSTLSFEEAGYTGNQLVAAWTATAYDSHGNVLSTVGQPLTSYFAPTPPQEFTLAGPGIASVAFYSNVQGVACCSLAIDDLSSPQLTATPEPATVALFGVGLLALGAGVRGRKLFTI